MYPDLSYFISDIFGTAPDNAFAMFKTFGVFLALAFLASAYVLYKEIKRKENEGIFFPQTVISLYDKSSVIKESIFNALLFFFVSFKIPYVFNNFDAFKADPASMVFSSKGSFVIGVLGGLIAFAFNYYKGINSKRLNVEHKIKVFPSQKVSDFTVVTAISGIFGARLFSIFENMDAFLADPIGQFFSGSGLTVYGGLICGFLGGYWYAKRLGMSPLHIMDAAAPAMAMGQIVGRLGCQFSGDGDWGIVNDAPKPSWFVFPDWAWSYDYGRNVLNRGVKMEDCIGNYCNHLVPGVYPTPIYEVLLMALTFAILWFCRKRIKVAGVIFFMYMFFGGIGRFFVEDFRRNETYELLGMDWSFSKYIALAIIATGLAGMTWLWMKRDKSMQA